MNKHGKDGGWALHALHRLESSMGLIVYSDNMYAWRLKPSSTTSDLPYSSFVILYLPIFPTHESFFGEVKNSQVLLTIWICTYSYLFTKRININKYYFFGILQKEYSWFPFSKKGIFMISVFQKRNSKFPFFVKKKFNKIVKQNLKFPFFVKKNLHNFRKSSSNKSWNRSSQGLLDPTNRHLCPPLENPRRHPACPSECAA